MNVKYGHTARNKDEVNVDEEMAMSRIPLKKWLDRRYVQVAAAIATTLAVGTMSGASVVTTYTTNPISLQQPAHLTGAPGLPFTGVTAGAFSVSSSFTGTLTVAPNSGPTGTPFTITGAGLPPSTSLQLVWGTSNATWVADVEPNTVNYLGDQYSAVTVNLATVMTNSSGAFTLATKAPTDFGGTHDIYAVQNAGALNAAATAHGGFMLTRLVKVWPLSGPVGTPITVTYTSLGASLYAGGSSVLYDNHYVGAMMGHWTRGTASTIIRASGSVGTHFIHVGDAISHMYMNIVQSPLAYVNGGSATFTVTPSGNTIPAPYISWPNNVAPTVNQFTTDVASDLDPTSSATAVLSRPSGTVNTSVTIHVTGLTNTGTTTPASGTYQLAWATVAGSRVNCASTCWTSLALPLGQANATNGTLNATFTVPNNLGGFHVVKVMDTANNVEAEAPFYVKESIVPFKNPAGKFLTLGVATANDSTDPAALAVGQSGVGTYTLHQNQEFTISMYGVGWTQFDNTLSVDYDNSYIGYGCGFASNGYMVIHLYATGGLGVHIIDLHPMLYTNSPTFTKTPYGMVPFLSSTNDYPGLALGYQIPTVHFAIKVIK